jgi:hypothetical protein
MGKRKRRLNKRELKDLDNIDRLLKEVSHQKVSSTPKIEAKSQPTHKNETVEINPTQVKIESSKPKCKMLKMGRREIPINKITVSSHGYQRIIERCNLKRTRKEEVESYIRKQLLKSQYLGLVTSSDGNEGEMFVNGKYSIHLSPENVGKVITILEHNKMPHSPVQDKVVSVVGREFRKLDRREKARIKQLELYELEADCEISELRLRMYKTKSESIKLSCEARIKALRTRLEELKNEIESIKSDKRKIAYTYCTCL